MARILFRDIPVNTFGDLPRVESAAPDFTLTGTDLADVSMSDFSDKNILMNVFPSLGTGVCQNSVRQFNERAAGHDDTVVLCVSADLPFAHKQFCAAEGIDGVVSLSTFRHPEFGERYGVIMVDGPWKGLMSRAVVVIDPDGTVIHTEQVPAIGQEPDYDAALSKL